jgi:hypothetical protein
LPTPLPGAVFLRQRLLGFSEQGSQFFILLSAAAGLYIVAIKKTNRRTA